MWTRSANSHTGRRLSSCRIQGRTDDSIRPRAATIPMFFPCLEGGVHRWKVRVLRERAQSGEWIVPSHEAELVWRGSGDVDLALLRLTGDPKLAPTTKPVFTSYDSIGSIEGVDGAGFPQ